MFFLLQIWIPRIQFPNRDPYPYIVNIEPGVGVVQEAGSRFEPLSLAHLRNARAYRGENSTLRWSATYRSSGKNSLYSTLLSLLPVIIDSSVAEPPYFWAALAPEISMVPESPLTELGRLRFLAKNGGSGSRQLHLSF